MGGWHFTEWCCEFIGTAFQLFVGFSIVAVMEVPGGPGASLIPSDGARLALIGVAFGVLAAIVALSPIGRRSGAHLNPAVTLGFYVRGHTHGHDLAGYSIAQVLGALVAGVGFAATWGSWARQVGSARTAPAVGINDWAAVGIEAAITFGLLVTILVMVSSSATARWTPAVVTGVLSGLIWAGAPRTGASMNPARTLGPDIATGNFTALWVYIVGPLAGAALAVGAYTLFSGRRTTLTAKLFHDPAYPSTQRTELPAKPHRAAGQTNGRADLATADALLGRRANDAA